MTALTTDPRPVRPTVVQLLDFAAAHPGPHTSTTDMAIRRHFGITPIRYIQLLNRAVTTPEALQHDPATTHRLIRESQAAAATRTARYTPDGITARGRATAACPRCGVHRILGSNSAAVCRDCRAVLTREEYRAWAA